jgi:ATPase subunit of ABC transporter with duplicated ATPase domains
VQHTRVPSRTAAAPQPHRTRTARAPHAHRSRTAFAPLPHPHPTRTPRRCQVDEMVASGQILPIRFPDPGKPEGIRTYRKPIMTMKNVCFTYEGTERQVLSDATVSVTLGSRVVLLGANGAGKTTFLKLLVGDLEATPGTGEAWTHHNLRVSYIAQHSLHHLEDYLNSNPIAYIQVTQTRT